MTALPRTVAEAAVWTPPDEVRSQPLYRAGYFVGSLDTLRIVGFDTDGVTAASTGEVCVHPGLEAALARQRETLAEARNYDRKPRPQTAPQLMAAARHSWALVERQVAEREIQQGVTV